MTFRDWDGLTECTTFSDFYKYCMYHKPDKDCPNCGQDLDLRLYPTFNMDKYGSALLICHNKECMFYNNPIKIQAIGGTRNETR